MAMGMQTEYSNRHAMSVEQYGNAGRHSGRIPWDDGPRMQGCKAKCACNGGRLQDNRMAGQAGTLTGQKQNIKDVPPLNLFRVGTGAQ